MSRRENDNDSYDYRVLFNNDSKEWISIDDLMERFEHLRVPPTPNEQHTLHQPGYLVARLAQACDDRKNYSHEPENIAERVENNPNAFVIQWKGYRHEAFWTIEPLENLGFAAEALLHVFEATEMPKDFHHVLRSSEDFNGSCSPEELLFGGETILSQTKFFVDPLASPAKSLTKRAAPTNFFDDEIGHLPDYWELDVNMSSPKKHRSDLSDPLVDIGL